MTRRLGLTMLSFALAAGIAVLALGRGGDGAGETPAPQPSESAPTILVEPSVTPEAADAEPARRPARAPRDRAKPPELPSSRQRARAQERGHRAPRVRRGYTPRKGEAVVPDGAGCTGPDVFDQPGCATIKAR